MINMRDVLKACEDRDSLEARLIIFKTCLSLRQGPSHLSTYYCVLKISRQGDEFTFGGVVAMWSDSTNAAAHSSHGHCRVQHRGQRTLYMLEIEMGQSKPG